MPDPEELTPPPDRDPFAEALQRLAPQPPHLSRDALLFAAGRAAAGPRLPAWVWPSATGAFAATSLVLAAFLVTPAAPGTVQTVERVVYINAPVPAPPAADPAPQPDPVPKRKARSAEESDAARMLQVRRDVLRWGPDMLPESRAAGRGPDPRETARDLERWLNLPPGTYAAYPPLPKKAKKIEVEEDDE